MLFLLVNLFPHGVIKKERREALLANFKYRLEIIIVLRLALCLKLLKQRRKRLLRRNNALKRLN